MRREDDQLSQADLTDLLSQDLIGSLDPERRFELQSLWDSAPADAAHAAKLDLDALAQSLIAMLPDEQVMATDMSDRVVDAVLGVGSLAGTFGESPVAQSIDVLGKIGSSNQAAVPVVPMQTMTANDIPNLSADVSDAMPLDDHAALQLIPSNRVSRFWRTAAMAGVSAAAILGVATVDVSNQVDQMEQLIGRTSFIDDIGSTLGGALKTSLFSEDVRIVVLTSETSKSEATLLANTKTGHGHLILNNADLTDGRMLSVVVLDALTGDVRTLATIPANAGWDHVDFEGLTFEQGQRIALVDSSTGKTLLTTRTLDFLIG